MSRNRMAALHVVHRCVDALRRGERDYFDSGNSSRDGADRARVEAVLTEIGVLDIDGFLVRTDLATVEPGRVAATPTGEPDQ